MVPTITLLHPVSTRAAVERRGRRMDAAKAALSVPPESLIGGGFSFPKLGLDPEPWVCTLVGYDAKTNLFSWSREARRGPPFAGTIELYHVYEALQNGKMHRDPPPPEKPKPKTKRRKRGKAKEAEGKPAGSDDAQEKDLQGDVEEVGRPATDSDGWPAE